VEFSRRTQWDLAQTPWAQELARMRATGVGLLDLTASNPTRCGFDYGQASGYESILAPLLDPQALVYDPNPRGSLPARKAVCEYYREKGALLDLEHLILTTSTSEAYSFLFRLLCDPGDEVLIAQPSYPLFEFLAQLDDVRLTPYELFYDHGWQIDLAGLARRVTPRTRAIAVVHPNNPTGHFTRARERAALENLCRERGLALIVDEVFLDYAWTGRGSAEPESSEPGASFALGTHEALTFVLSGLSKIAALPQMKAAWIAAFGPHAELAPALDRLEVISDTFLSMSAPVQCALGGWLRERHLLQQQIATRVMRNLALLDGLLARQKTVTRLVAEAGWYAILRIPALEHDEQTALRLLTCARTAVHPGYFFGFPDAGWLVVSLLPREEELAEGAAAVLHHFDDSGGYQDS
jgi:alanine-synthesizing transaminase